MLSVHLGATVVIVKVPLAEHGNGRQQAPDLPQIGKGLLFSCRQGSVEGHGGVLRAVLFPHEICRIGSEMTSKAVPGVCCSG